MAAAHFNTGNRTGRTLTLAARRDRRLTMGVPQETPVLRATHLPTSPP